MAHRPDSTIVEGSHDAPFSEDSAAWFCFDKDSFCGISQIFRGGVSGGVIPKALSETNKEPPTH
eukprot:3071880-Prorocentrum_lima.AAC.1